MHATGLTLFGFYDSQCFTWTKIILTVIGTLSVDYITNINKDVQSVEL